MKNFVGLQLLVFSKLDCLILQLQFLAMVMVVVVVTYAWKAPQG